MPKPRLGSKKQLFLRVLALYAQRFVDPGVALLSNPTTLGAERIAQFFAGAPKDERRGCLLCNAAAGPAGG